MRVVLDTNVLVAGLRSRRGTAIQVLARLPSGQLVPALSVTLMLEYEDVLRRPGLVPLEPAAVTEFLNLLVFYGHPQRIYYLWRPTLSDPKDDMLLELAVAARCEFIVTFNVRHFRGTEKFGVRAITPHQLLQLVNETTLEPKPNHDN